MIAVVFTGSGRARADARTLEAVLNDARDSGKPVILEFSAAWCEPCKLFKQHVLPNDAIQAALADFVFVEYDIDESPGTEVATRYDVSGVPAFVAVDGDGVERKRLSSLPKDRVENFLEFLRSARVLALDRSAVDAMVDAGDAQGHLDAARWHADRGDIDGALALYDRAIELDTAPTAPVGQIAAWETAELRAERDHRERTVGDAADYVRAYPGTDRATVALARVVFADAPDHALVDELFALHLSAVRGMRQLHYLVYLALAAGALDAALVAAEALSEVAGADYVGAFSRAEVHHQRGEIDQALAAADEALAASHNESYESKARALRDRIERGDKSSRGVDHVRDHGADYFGAVFGADTGDSDRAAFEAEWEREKVFYRARQSLLRAAAKACHRNAGDPDQVWVRIMLGAPDAPPASVIILEPGVSTTLARCLERELQQMSLPPAPPRYDGQVNDAVRYAPRRPVAEETLDDIGPLDQAFVVGSASVGVVDALAVGGRAMFRVGKFDVFHGALTVDGFAGAETGDDQLLYDARVMVGLGTGRDSVSAGLTVGAGISRAGDVLPRAYEVPAELFLIVSGDDVRGQLWARSAWILDSDVRDDGAPNSFFASDELSAGFLLRLPARTGAGVVVGAEYTEARDDNGFTIFVGTSLDSLF